MDNTNQPKTIHCVFDNIHKLNIPKPVGQYCINKELFVQFQSRPSWFHRKMTKLFLGWVWKDYG